MPKCSTKLVAQKFHNEITVWSGGTKNSPRNSMGTFATEVLNYILYTL